MFSVELNTLESPFTSRMFMRARLPFSLRAHTTLNSLTRDQPQIERIQQQWGVNSIQFTAFLSGQMVRSPTAEKRSKQSKLVNVFDRFLKKFGPSYSYGLVKVICNFRFSKKTLNRTK